MPRAKSLPELHGRDGGVRGEAKAEQGPDVSPMIMDKPTLLECNRVAQMKRAAPA